MHVPNHPNDSYYDRIDPLLEDLQDEFNKICAKKPNEKYHQDALIMELNDLSAFILKRIKEWKYLLRSDAKSERIFSIKRMM